MLSPKSTPYQGHWQMEELEHKPWCSDSESGPLLTLSYCLLYPLFPLPVSVLLTSRLDFLRSRLHSVFAITLCISQGSFNFKCQKSHSKKIYWFTYREGWGGRWCQALQGLRAHWFHEFFFSSSLLSPASCRFLASSTSCRCFVFVVASPAGNSSYLHFQHVLFQRKESGVFHLSVWNELHLSHVPTHGTNNWPGG